MELISKEELIDRMYHEAFEVDSELQKWESGCWIRYKLFENILDEMPTIDSNKVVYPCRPKGEWQASTEGTDYRVCSICNYTRHAGTKYNYCPNCGADMRGEK